MELKKWESPVLSEQSIARVMKKHHQAEVEAGNWKPMAEHLLYLFGVLRKNIRAEVLQEVEAYCQFCGTHYGIRGFVCEKCYKECEDVTAPMRD